MGCSETRHSFENDIGIIVDASSGASDDWTKGELGVKYAFTLELPPSDADAQGNGFIVPTSAIPAVARATWPGIKTMASK